MIVGGGCCSEQALAEDCRMVLDKVWNEARILGQWYLNTLKEPVVQ